MPFLKCLGTWRVGYFGAPDTSDDHHINVSINDDPIDTELPSHSNRGVNYEEHDDVVSNVINSPPPTRQPPNLMDQHANDDDFNPRG